MPLSIELLSKSLSNKEGSTASIAARGGIGEKDREVVKKIIEEEGE